MLAELSTDNFNLFFAYAPWIIGLIILLVTYFSVRGQLSSSVPIGQTFACANCGRRGHREAMVPVTHEGAMSWYCSTCAKKP
jgi:hypothetical protein